MLNSFVERFFTDFARIVRILDRRGKLKAVGLFCLMGLQTALELLFILSLTWMGAALTDPEGLRSHLLFKGFFFCIPSLEPVMQDSRYLLLLAGSMVISISLLKNAVNYFTAKSTALFSEHISINVGAEIMSRFLYRDYTWHLSSESASTFQRMMWRGNLAHMLISLLSMYASILTVLVLFVSLVGQEPALTSMVVGIVCTVGFFLYSGIRRNVDRQARNAAESSQAETSALMCATKGIRDVLIYRQQKIFLQAIVEAARKGVWPRTFNSIAPTMPTWVLEATGFVVVLVSIAYLVYIEQAAMPRIAEAMGLLMLTAWRVLPYANRVVSFQVMIRSLHPTTTAVLELLEQLRAVPSEPPPEPA
ncbi:MAG: ABC transporter ATP-binding protein, partial [Desulfovibrionaceae bacterium]|nr:ABC transporter ATP-binding protein [Desulfovibrionaceae bacterium]